MALGQVAEQVDDAQGAALIGLDGDPEPLPTSEGGLGAERGEEVQAEIQARGLLGVDGQSDVAGLRGLGQLDELGQGSARTRSPWAGSSRGCRAESFTETPGPATGPWPTAAWETTAMAA